MSMRQHDGSRKMICLCYTNLCDYCYYVSFSPGGRKGEQFLEKERNLLKISRFLKLLAEREGFEPPVPLGTTVFKTVVIDHSTISPVLEKRVQR